jgi:hypothetical protein
VNFRIKQGYVLLLLIIAVALAGCVDDKKQASSVPQEDAAGAAPAAANSTNSLALPQAKAESIKCELCHKDPQDLRPHVNGGKLCVSCHGGQVHNIHIGPGTVGLQCDSCHGFPPKVPTVNKGEGVGHYTVCENCHAPPPDSLKPSLGNLVNIHLSRAKYCTNCHGTDIGATHAASIASASVTK